jgi:hypothetical protein
MAHIEVYEWKEGAPRPGTLSKHRDSCIDILEVPPDGLPNVGDVLLITIDPKEMAAPHRVISREFFWARNPVKDSQALQDSQVPQKYYKMWIHVRPLTDEEYQADENAI